VTFAKRCNSISSRTELRSSVASIGQSHADELTGFRPAVSRRTQFGKADSETRFLSAVPTQDVKNCLRRLHAIPEVDESHAGGDPLQYRLR
jgi:hypothetical protein